MKWQSSCLLVLVTWLAGQGVLELELFRHLDEGDNRPSSLRASASQASTQNASKPLLILHVGPPKTGTTTIQSFAIQARALMERDNVYYVGNGNFPGGISTHDLVRNCRERKKSDCIASWNDFATLLDHHHAQRHTVIVSEENFSGFIKVKEDELLWPYLIPITKKWNVRIVFAYRRYYEGVVSLYYQKHDPSCTGYFCRQKFERWPSQGGKEIPSISQFVADHERLVFSEPHAVMKRWEAKYGNVWIFNFNSENDLLQDFFCQMVPELELICEYLSAYKTNRTENPSSSKKLHFDMIVVEAYKRGWINKRLSRKAVAKATEEHAKELGLSSLTDFPLETLPSHLAADLLHHSVTLESELVPEFHASPVGQHALKEGFVRYMETGRLASVDAKAALSDPRWKSFFEKLS